MNQARQRAQTVYGAFSACATILKALREQLMAADDEVEDLDDFRKLTNIIAEHPEFIEVALRLASKYGPKAHREERPDVS